MNYQHRALLLLALTALLCPLASRAQDPPHAATVPPTAGAPADDHDHDHAAGEHDADHPAPPAAVPAAPPARPGWVWPLVGALLLGASAAPRLAVRAGRPALGRWFGGLAVLAAAGLLLGTLPPTPDGSHAEEHAGEHGDEHADEAGGQSPLLEVDPTAAAALGVRTTMVAPRELTSTLQTTGQIIAVEARQAHLGPRVPGRLTSVPVRVGDRVAAGQVVATLDSVDAAQAAAAGREAAAQLSAAERNLAVRRRLVASGLVTQAPLEEARRQLAATSSAQAQAAAALAQGRNELDAARAELERTNHLVAQGTVTTAAEEDARQRLATAEQELAAARATVAEVAADVAEAESAVEAARLKLTAASDLEARTTRLVATGELDRAPLEQAQQAVVAARSAAQQSDVALEQATRAVQRGEELHRAELLALNDLEARRSARRERQAQHDEATAALATAQAALRRQEQISGAQMIGGRAQQDATNSVAEARREVAAATTRQSKLQARHEAVTAAIAPAQAAVAAAKGALHREQVLAGDQTRGQSATAAARLRLLQAERAVAGQSAEAAAAARQVSLATAALAREQRLARDQVRGRELLLEAEREVSTARIAQRNAAEMLQLLGAAASAGTRPQIPLRAPLAGLVTHLEASVGEAVGAEQELLTVVDLSEVYVEADVAERDLPQVAEGQVVQVTLRAWPGQTVLGVVVSISGQLDPATRAAHVRARLANPTWRLRPGMFAQVGFVTGQRSQVLSVPPEAIQELAGRDVVFVQQTPSRYEVRPVVLGQRTVTQVEVRDGLRVGEVVVTAGSYLLKSQRLKGELGDGHAH